MPIDNPIIRALLFGMFDDVKLANAVAHAFITEDNMTQRELAREFGIPRATLQDAIKHARNKFANFCEQEEILPEELMLMKYNADRTAIEIVHAE